MKQRNKHFSFIFLVLAILVFASCRTLDLKILMPENKNPNLLPALETAIDVSSIEQHLSYNITKTTTIASEEDNEATVLQTLSQDRPMSTTSNDFKVLFERDVKYNITEPTFEKKGRIVCKVAALNNDPGSLILFLFSGMTLGVLNLVGLPANSCSSSIDIEVELYNLNNELVAQYQAIGESRIFSGLYYGYMSPSDLRAANIKAFKKAMDIVKQQINADSHELIAALNS